MQHVQLLWLRLVGLVLENELTLLPGTQQCWLNRSGQPDYHPCAQLTLGLKLVFQMYFQTFTKKSSVHF